MFIFDLVKAILRGQRKVSIINKLRNKSEEDAWNEQIGWIKESILKSNFDGGDDKAYYTLISPYNINLTTNILSERLSFQEMFFLFDRVDRLEEAFN